MRKITDFMPEMKDLTISNEEIVIDRQSSGFFKEMVALIQHWRNNPTELVLVNKSIYDFTDEDFLKAPDNEAFAKLVKKHTGMTAKFHVVKDNDIKTSVANTMMFAPVLHNSILDIQHDIFGKYNKKFFDKVSETIEKDYPEGFKGTVSRKTGKVTGDFTKLFNTVTTGYTFITSNDFPVEAVAAVLMHEIGHCFTFMAALGVCFRTNVVLLQLMSNLNKSTDLKEREVSISIGLKHLNVDMDKGSIQDLAHHSDKVVVSIVSGNINHLKSISDSDQYDLTAAEQTADQYVARQGGGFALAQGLEIINRMYDPSIFKKKAEIQAAQFIAINRRIFEGYTVLDVILTIFSALGWLYLFFRDRPINVYQDMVNRYDTGVIRIQRMREDLVNQLKTSGGKSNQILQDIKAIDSIIALYKTDEAFINKLLKKRFQKDRVKQAQLARELESLAANDLFVLGHELKTY